MTDRLEFRGKWSDIIGPIWLMILAGIFTLGIAVPWAFISYRKRIMHLTYLQNQPLDYDGRGGEYFGELLIGFLLTVVTLGLYSVLGFYQARLLRYDVNHTILPDGRRLDFQIHGIDFFGQYLLIGFLSAITFGIYTFWGYARMRRFILEHTFVDQRPLRFDGTGGQFLGNSLVIFLLSVVTLGIYGILCAGNARIIHWDGEHTIVPVN
jgi:uncharacterized membrane protein YjgN (DUF898 family)